MDYIVLKENLPWGTAPNITLRISYKYQRSGADMQYQIRIDNIKLPFADSRFGFPIYGKIYLDNTVKATKTIKNATPSTWSSLATWETGWLTVKNKISGSTSLKVNIYSGSGESRDKTYSYNLTVTAAASKIKFLSATKITDTESITVTPTAGAPTGYKLQYCLASEAGKGADIITWLDGNGGNPKTLNLSSANRSKMYTKAINTNYYQPWVYIRTVTADGKDTQLGAADKRQITVSFIEDDPEIEVTKVASTFNKDLLKDEYKEEKYIYTKNSALTINYSYVIKKNGLCKQILVDNTSIPNPTSKSYTTTKDVTNSKIKIVDSRGWKSSEIKLIPSNYILINDYFIPSISWKDVPSFTIDSSSGGDEKDKVSISGKINASYSLKWNGTDVKNQQIKYFIKDSTGIVVKEGQVENDMVSVSDLSYSDKYTVEIKYTDDILKNPLIISYSGSAIPIFDWGKNDFNFNVPVSFSKLNTEPGKSQLADYIVEQGEKNNWSYRKWASGYSELSTTATVSATTMSAAGNIYYSEPIYIDLPFYLTKEYTTQYTSRGAGVIAATYYGSGSGDRTGMRLQSGSSRSISNVGISIYITGKWK